jgi:protein-disulfide isomerase
MSMRLMTIAALFATALLIAATGKPAAGNWLGTLIVTPSGSHVQGNPNAQLKLTEFISYTCSHCADFDREATDRMRAFMVQPGKLSIEVRHLVRDPIDMTVAMLTNCGAPAKFFLNHSAFLRSQAGWIAAANRSTPAQRQRWNTGSNVARFRAIASDFKFYTIMASRGYDRRTVDRCLTDDAMTQKLVAQTQGATQLGIEGTPSFLLNGELLAGTHNWAGLKLQLEARTMPVT